MGLRIEPQTILNFHLPGIDIAWATLPLDGKHRPRWSKEHLVAGVADMGARTLCGRIVPMDAFELDRGSGQQDWCLACRKARVAT